MPKIGEIQVKIKLGLKNWKINLLSGMLDYLLHAISIWDFEPEFNRRLWTLRKHPPPSPASRRGGVSIGWITWFILNLKQYIIMPPTPTPTPLLSVALPGELWPVGPLRTQHVNFLEREMESFAEVQNILLNWPIGSSGSSSRIKFEPLIKENWVQSPTLNSGSKSNIGMAYNR